MVTAALIQKYFPDIPDSGIEKFSRLGNLYSIENEKVNLISRKDLENLYINHVLHSLALAKFCNFPGGAKVIDIGTGGGFPGIPLAILYPNTEFILCDSIGKKINAVNQIIGALKLANAKAVNSRTEDIPGKFDIAVARAVAPMVKLYSWMENKWINKPCFYLLKGGDLNQEMSELLNENSRLKLIQHNISEIFSEPFFETKKVIQILGN